MKRNTMAPPEKDPYQILGVSRTATQDEIRNAYRGLAKKFHPDLNPGKKEAEARFKDIGIAYEKIGSVDSRAKFERGESEAAEAEASFRSGRDRYYQQTQSGKSGGRYTQSFGEGFDEDLFANLFRGSAGPTKGSDQAYRMEIDLKDSILGAEREVTLGNGKKLAVKIPAGVSEGSRLRFAGQGNPGREGAPSGDAYVEITVRNDPRFRREGNDLVTDLPISIAEAVLGAAVRVPTVEGAVEMKIPVGANSGQRLRIAGKGVRGRDSAQRGDLYVLLQIRLPETIDPTFRAAVETWSREHPYDPRTERTRP